MGKLVKMFTFEKITFKVFIKFKLSLKTNKEKNKML